MQTNSTSPETLKPWELDSSNRAFTRHLRMPKNGTRSATEYMVYRIDHKIKKLAALGLRPHPTMLGYRQELMEQLDGNGPYRLRVSSGIF